MSRDDGTGFAERIANRLGELFALQEERTRAQIAAGLIETRNALRLQGARSESLDRSRQVSGGNARLVGWSLRAAGGAATVTLHDGRVESLGDVLASVGLAADGASSTEWLGGGVSITEGCYAVVTGNVSGAIYLGGQD